MRIYWKEKEKLISDSEKAEMIMFLIRQSKLDLISFIFKLLSREGEGDENKNRKSEG